MLLLKISRVFTILRFSNCVFVRTSSDETLMVTFCLWSCGDNGEKSVAVNTLSNQWSSYDDTLAADLELSVQNYFSRLRALHNFYPLDVARLTDASFSYAPNGFGLPAPVRIEFSLASLYMSTLKWHGTIVVCTLACSSHCFLSPLCTWVCVFVYTSKWYHTCLINTLLAINILHILYTRHRTCFMLCSALYMLNASKGGIIQLCGYTLWVLC